MKTLITILTLLIAIQFCNAQTISFTLNQQPCNSSGPDGILSATVTGMTFPISFQWTETNGYNTTTHTVNSATDLLTNYSGTPMSLFVYNGVSSAFANYVGAPPFTYVTTIIPQQCPNANGTLSTIVTGGTPPYTFEYTQGFPGTFFSSSNPVLAPPNNVYNVKITDNAGCVYGSLYQYDTFYLSSIPAFALNETQTAANCTNGTISINSITGGTPPYSYLWNNNSTSSSLSNLTTGNYNVIVTDASNCNVNEYYYLPQAITINVNTTPTPATCTNSNGSIIAFASGGMNPYSYLWNGTLAGQSINNIPSGYYNVSVIDANGCLGSGAGNVVASTPIVVSNNVTPSMCSSGTGTATLIITGGQTPYSVTWNTSPIQTGVTATNLLPGYYSFHVVDANGCLQDGSVYISPISNVYATTNSTTSICNGATGTSTINVTSGTAPYIYSWSTSPVQTTATATNLAVGNYSYLVTDVNGCTFNGNATINTINPIVINSNVSQATCLIANGSITTNISGGTPPYTFLWNNNATTQNLLSITQGTYNLTVTDNVGCSSSKNINLNYYSPMSLGLNTTPTSCIYANDGNIVATPLGGTPPFTWNAGNASMSNLGTGYYYFSVSDVNGCYASNSSNVGCSNSSNACYCTIHGTVYNDINNNCIQDAGEMGIENIQIHCAGFGYTYTDINGNYSFQVPNGTYILSETVLSFYPLSSCQNNLNNITVVASAGCTQTVNFANSINPIHDMKINTWDMNYPIPGFAYSQKTIITNMGTVTEPNVVAGYTSDGQINQPTFLPTLPFVFGNNNWFTTNNNIISLLPATSSVYYQNYNVPTTTPLNTSLIFKDSVCASSPISNWINDYSPWDNVKYLSTNVVGSYDPNFKEVSPKGVGASGDIFAKDSVLDYMIHFQNFGNYYAQNVVVLDSLDADLDWTTLRPINQSHPCKISINENGVAKFEFNNIQLPSKNMDELASQGMVSYTIKHKKNLAIGTQIKNSASIYFDYNAPVKTNTTLNTIAAPTSVKENILLSNSLTIYPNPTNDLLNVSIEKQTIGSQVKVTIIDISGKIIQTKNIKISSEKQIEILHLNQLVSGLYFIELQTKEGKISSKFIKN